MAGSSEKQTLTPTLSQGERGNGIAGETPAVRGNGRALPMPVTGARAWRTCRDCGMKMRIERFAKSTTTKSGYGCYCLPCFRARQREYRRGRRELEIRDAKERTGKMRPSVHEPENGNGARDKRFEARQRRCLGPCREMFHSTHCAHRFCPGCSRMNDRSSERKGAGGSLTPINADERGYGEGNGGDG